MKKNIVLIITIVILFQDSHLLSVSTSKFTNFTKNIYNTIKGKTPSSNAVIKGLAATTLTAGVFKILQTQGDINIALVEKMKADNRNIETMNRNNLLMEQKIDELKSYSLSRLKDPYVLLILTSFLAIPQIVSFFYKRFKVKQKLSPQKINNNK